MSYHVSKNGKPIDYITWITEQRDWIIKGKSIFKKGLEYHKINLEKNPTKEKVIVKDILNKIESTLLLLNTFSEESSNEYSHTLFKNVESDVEELKQDSKLFLTLGGFESLE